MSADAARISAFGPPFTARRSEVARTPAGVSDMSERSHSVSLDRRTFLKPGVLGGGGLVINLALPLALRPAFAPNAFIRIDPQTVVTLVMPMVPLFKNGLDSDAVQVAIEQPYTCPNFH